MKPFFQRGASMTELLIALPMFLMLIFIIAELSLIYQAKSILDMAALAAARAGAINGGAPSSMKNAAAAAMAPLYAPGNGTTGGIAKSLADANTPHMVGSTDIIDVPTGARFNSLGGGSHSGIKIEILSPTKQMMKDFGVNRNYVGGSNSSDKVKVIPNDNLMYRDTKLINQVNVQDANLLKIRVTYLYETKMPMVRYFFTPLMNANLTGVFFGGQAPGNTDDKGWRIPLVSYATVRMQSDFKEASLSAAVSSSPSKPVGPGGPGPSDPGPSDPGPSDPGPGDPGPGDPGPGDPGPGDPGPGDPGPGDPGPSDPGPSDPGPGNGDDGNTDISGDPDPKPGCS